MSNEPQAQPVVGQSPNGSVESTEAAILDRRAEALARAQTKESARRIAHHLVVLKAGKDAVGLPVTCFEGIVPLGLITPLPGLPSAVQGIVQVRGEILSVADLAVVLKSGRTGKAAFLAVVSTSRGKVGLLADEVTGHRDVYEDEIARSFAQTPDQQQTRPILATTRDLLTIIDLERLCNSPDILHERRVQPARALGDAP